MDYEKSLEEHKSVISILLDLLPLATPRFKYSFFIFKKENELNILVSKIIIKFYLLDLSNKRKDFLNNQYFYEQICEAYDYILNVIDNAGEKYSQDKVNEIKKFLDLN